MLIYPASKEAEDYRRGQPRDTGRTKLLARGVHSPAVEEIAPLSQRPLSFTRQILAFRVILENVELERSF